MKSPVDAYCDFPTPSPPPGDDGGGRHSLLPGRATWCRCEPPAARRGWIFSVERQRTCLCDGSSCGLSVAARRGGPAEAGGIGSATRWSRDGGGGDDAVVPTRGAYLSFSYCGGGSLSTASYENSRCRNAGIFPPPLDPRHTPLVTHAPTSHCACVVRYPLQPGKGSSPSGGSSPGGNSSPGDTGSNPLRPTSATLEDLPSWVKSRTTQAPLRPTELTSAQAWKKYCESLENAVRRLQKVLL